ncbi:hypothetical protein VZT92_009228 [Zoarces viviparus]|uniref:Uncharacterized protein n=1 Tax=Zoarces viviparus TaxID=48416 RepID=A0AAW1FHF3_ZOAVI
MQKKSSIPPPGVRGVHGAGCSAGCLRLWKRKSAPLLLLLLLLLLLFGPRTHCETRELHFPPTLDALNSREGEQRRVSVAKSQRRGAPPPPHPQL